MSRLDVAERLAGQLALEVAVDHFASGKIGQRRERVRQAGAAAHAFDQPLLLHGAQVAAHRIHGNPEQLPQLGHLDRGLQLKLL